MPQDKCFDSRCSTDCSFLQWVVRHKRWGCFDEPGLPRYVVLEEGDNQNAMPLRQKECYMNEKGKKAKEVVRLLRASVEKEKAIDLSDKQLLVTLGEGFVLMGQGLLDVAAEIKEETDDIARVAYSELPGL